MVPENEASKELEISLYFALFEAGAWTLDQPGVTRAEDVIPGETLDELRQHAAWKPIKPDQDAMAELSTTVEGRFVMSMYGWRLERELDAQEKKGDDWTKSKAA